MAKKNPRGKKKNKQEPQKGRFKSELIDDNRKEHYELSEEFARNNPLKTPPNKETTKKK